MVPMRELIRPAFTGILRALPCTRYSTQSDTMVISIRHHTRRVESSVIALPRTPVNPHKKTAAFSCISAFFIPSKVSELVVDDFEFLVLVPCFVFPVFSPFIFMSRWNL